MFGGLFGGEAVSETGMGGRVKDWCVVVLVFLTSCVSLLKDLTTESRGGSREQQTDRRVR